MTLKERTKVTIAYATLSGICDFLSDNNTLYLAKSNIKGDIAKFLDFSPNDLENRPFKVKFEAAPNLILTGLDIGIIKKSFKELS